MVRHSAEEAAWNRSIETSVDEQIQRSRKTFQVDACRGERYVQRWSAFRRRLLQAQQLLRLLVPGIRRLTRQSCFHSYNSQHSKAPSSKKSNPPGCRNHQTMVAIGEVAACEGHGLEEQAEPGACS